MASRDATCDSRSAAPSLHAHARATVPRWVSPNHDLSGFPVGGARHALTTPMLIDSHICLCSPAVRILTGLFASTGASTATEQACMPHVDGCSAQGGNADVPLMLRTIRRILAAEKPSAAGVVWHPLGWNQKQPQSPQASSGVLTTARRRTGIAAGSNNRHAHTFGSRLRRQETHMNQPYK